ncbi:MAG TPA: FecR domain-containing protein [Burkholderiales bacterium]|nr:FecR domain-containing protein [Burkholderiales bacterium]
MRMMRLAAYVIGAGMSWALAAPALAAVAGTVDSLAGSVSITRSGTAAQPLGAGASVNEGDQIATAADAWVLLEMVDGGSLTLRGKTRMRIDAYVYSETDKASGKSWLSLLEGAMRSVTGAIGAFNPPSYRLNTPVVTLGIRGTDHETAYFPPGSTEPGIEPGVYDKVNQGETFLRTPHGEVRLKAGQAGFSDHQGARAPRLLSAIPAFYRRHAEIDRPLANRMRAIQTRREKKLQFLKQRFEHRAQAAGGRPGLREHREGKPASEGAGPRRQRARAQHGELYRDGSGGQAGPDHERKQRRQHELR